MVRFGAVIISFVAALLVGLAIASAVPTAKPCTWQVQYHSFGHYEEVEKLLNSLTPAQARNAKIVSYHGYSGDGTPASDLAVWVCVP